MPYQDSYVAKIREKIGHDFTLVMPTVDMIIENAGKLMLVYNRDFDAWAFPGGYVEPELPWVENATREAFEEAGVVIKPEVVKMIGSVSGPYYRAKYPNGDTTQLFTNVFWSNQLESEQAEIDESEIDDKRWATPAEIMQLQLTDSGAAVFEVYQKYQLTKQPQLLTRANRID
ncbi:hypothetical protein IV73_GL001144 [Weissella kandleri]|uniref:Nudix hydrolase domain-containing protein n=1 Tax=Weissella kandleri TaxID=1616 RepID=A0A0R2JBR3_9LACO|nr:NUDIX domain-containing protein [Weissella kandleri]KRN74736.1 hypothetical protein IV73_GL001144 [Weissella kandleri]